MTHKRRYGTKNAFEQISSMDLLIFFLYSFSVIAVYVRRVHANEAFVHTHTHTIYEKRAPHAKNAHHTHIYYLKHEVIIIVVLDLIIN